MIDVTRLLEVFKKLKESGVDLNDCVVCDRSDGDMPKNTEFIVMQKKDLKL
jgi:hypothetical protein